VLAATFSTTVYDGPILVRGQTILGHTAIEELSVAPSVTGHTRRDASRRRAKLATRSASVCWVRSAELTAA
jgi:hypothetical protein